MIVLQHLTYRMNDIECRRDLELVVKEKRTYEILSVLKYLRSLSNFSAELGMHEHVFCTLG